MKKTFMGVRLRSLREERGLSQLALAQQLGLSPSYLNQIEQNQRPLTVPVLLRLHATLGVDIQAFSEDEEARLIASLREALADNPGGDTVALAELREVATQMPAVGRALVALHQRHRDAMERLEALAGELGDGRGDLARLPQARPMPFEEDDLGFEAIKAVPTGGHFFGCEHTMARYETAFYRPMLSNWQNYGSWQEAGGHDALERATLLWQQALHDYEEPVMDPAIREELDAYVARRKEEIGAGEP